jgi:hypothetical protein
MLTKPLNTFLLIAAVIGAVLAYRVARQHQELSSEHRRLEALVGSLPIEDPTKIHVRAINTGEELHFAWRIYAPAGARVKWQYDSGSGTSMNSEPSQAIARVRLRQQEDGSVHVFIKRGGGASRMQLGDQEFGRVLREHWSEIEVEQLAVDEVVALEVDEVVTLLRLTLPEAVMQEAEQRVRPEVVRRFRSSLLSIRFGTDGAFQHEAAKEAGDE